jgi:hypothetical protein
MRHRLSTADYENLYHGGRTMPGNVPHDEASCSWEISIVITAEELFIFFTNRFKKKPQPAIV